VSRVCCRQLRLTQPGEGWVDVLGCAHTVALLTSLTAPHRTCTAPHRTCPQNRTRNRLWPQDAPLGRGHPLPAQHGGGGGTDARARGTVWGWHGHRR
jgi:hypothetical protein